MSIFHLHDWSDWSITERGQVADPNWGEVIGSYIIQDRFCRTCGKHKIKQQRTGSIRTDVKLIADEKPSIRVPRKDLA